MPDRLIHRLNGPRGSTLLAAGWVATLHAAAYSPLSQPPAALPSGLAAVERLVPMPVYGALWAAAAVIALVGAFRTKSGAQRDHFDAWGFGACVGMLLAWAGAYGVGAVLALLAGDPSRQWLISGLYAGVAVILAGGARMTNPMPPGGDVG